jgi:hypothetical protein
MNVYADPELIQEIMIHLQRAYRSIDTARDIMIAREINLIGKDKSNLADHNVGPASEWVREMDKQYGFHDRDKLQNMIIEAKLAGGKYRILLDKLLAASDAILEIAEQDDRDDLVEEIMA